jgi:hypothetical protein
VLEEDQHEDADVLGRIFIRAPSKSCPYWAIGCCYGSQNDYRRQTDRGAVLVDGPRAPGSFEWRRRT